MDYSTFKNSIMVIDLSAWQQVEFTLTQPSPVDVFEFLEQEQITVCAPAEAKNELGYQVYEPNLLSGVYSDADGSTTTSGGKGCSNAGYVLSRINGSLTPANLQPDGLDVILVESSSLYSSTSGGQLSLWDTTPIMQKLLRNKKTLVDYANIVLARYFQNKGENVFVFINDQKQIKQLKCEGIKYLRPDNLFAWMCKTGHIGPRKRAWNFKKRRDHNDRWTKPSTNFKNNLH